MLESVPLVLQLSLMPYPGPDMTSKISSLYLETDYPIFTLFDANTRKQ